jgi:hypothetical protein
MGESLRDEEIITELAAKVEAILMTYALEIPDESTRNVINLILSKQEHEMGKSRHQLLEEMATDPDDIADYISRQVLLLLVEERPGTNPFDHEGTIPVPLQVFAVAMHNLTLVANVAVVNNSLGLSRDTVQAVGSMAYLIAESTIAGIPSREIEIPIGENDEMETITGPFILTPQSGVAYIIRRLEGAEDSLHSGTWKIPESESDVELDELIDDLVEIVPILVSLNKHYGQSGEPTELS